MTLADEELRRACLTDFDMLACVEAAAGTGKTSLMAGRVAMLLADGRPPGQIAALSFTDAAASELSRRIHAVVASLIAGKVPDELKCALPDGRLSEPQQVRLEAVVGQLDELTSCTIHSFCQTIIVDHGVSAGLDPGAATAEDGVAEFLFDDAFASWLVEALSSGQPGDEAIVAFVKDLDGGPVERLKRLARFWKERRGASFAEPDLSKRHDVELIDAIDELNRWVGLNRYDLATNDFSDGLSVLRTHFADCFAGLLDFQKLMRLTVPPRVFGMKEKSFEFLPFDKVETWRSTRREDWAALRVQADAHYQAVVGAFATVMGEIAAAMAHRISTSLRRVLERYDEAKRRAAVMDYDDLLAHARDLLNSPDDRIRQAVGERYRYILVDEFQDTNQVQTEILFSIAAESASPDWLKAKLRPGALFLVGDPKQSIYHFRQADIAAYHLARDAITSQGGGRLLPITANFRSRRRIIEYVNACFAPVFAIAGQPDYVPLTATVDDIDSSVPCVAKLPVAGRKRWQLCAAEAEGVASLCQDIIGRLPVRRSDGKVELASPRDIALLAPDYRDLWRYERAIEARGIPVTSQASKALMGRQETQDVLVLLRAVADPTDRLAFGAFLRGPMVGISDQVMLSVAESLSQGDDRYGLNIRTPLDSIPDPYVRSVVEALQYLRSRALSVPPSQLLAEALDVLRARLVVTWRHRNRYARALANLEALVDMARQYATAGLHAFVQELQRLWENKVTSQEGRGDTSDDAVQIVTMHSSKGLEWPVVIPVGTANSVLGGGPIVHRRSDNTIHWLVGGVAAPDLQVARLEEEQEDRLEKQRMWYVASTRARDLLVLPQMAQSDEGSWAKVVQHAFADVPEIDLSGLGTAEKSENASQPNKQDAKQFATEAAAVLDSAPPMRWAQPSSHDHERSPAVLDLPETFETVPGWVAPVGAGRTRGSVMHKLIEEILTGETPAEYGELSHRSGELLRQIVARDGNPDGELPDPIEIARTALAALNSDDVVSLRPHILAEVSVWGREGDRHTAGRADALVVYEGKVVGVLDWKSDVEVTAQLRAQYLQQVQDYLELTGATAGAVVFATTGEVLWAGDRERLFSQVLGVFA